jgi:hypothetical protein
MVILFSSSEWRGDFVTAVAQALKSVGVCEANVLRVGEYNVLVPSA